MHRPARGPRRPPLSLLLLVGLLLPPSILHAAPDAAADPSVPASSTDSDKPAASAASTSDDLPKAPRHSIDASRLFPGAVEKDGRVELFMTVGTVEERHSALRLAKGETARARLIRAGAGSSAARLDRAAPPRDALLLRFVVPDDLEGHRYDLAVRLDGRLLHERSGATRGFGRRSLFIPLPALSPAGEGPPDVEIENRCDEPLYVDELLYIPDLESFVSRPFAAGDFVLSFLIGERLDSKMLDRLAGLIDAAPVRKAIAHEVYFAARDDGQLDKIAKATREVCDRLNFDFLASTCSWWAGTPPVVRERLEFQQVCWSETDTHDDGEGLRKLLGDKWDIRYGLSIPNKWSSTPWQTMNNPELNRMRRERTEAAVRIFEKHLAERTVGYVSENEPAYWAFEESDEKYPVNRHPLWADFNPCVVADAAREGVVLDPTDGLDLIERAWLQYNVARYNEANIEAIRRGKPSGRVYSHALLDYNHFPLHGTGHARPYAEAARVRNARLGVEMLWGTDMDALWRIREWGAWGCINREECDGFDIRYHIATLRACYMLAADCLNSYNWNGMGREGDPIEYFNTLLRDAAGDGVVVVAERGGGGDSGAGGWRPVRQWKGAIEKNAAFPWFNQLELFLKCANVNTPLDARLARTSDGAVVAFRSLQPGETAKDGATLIDFGDLAWLQQDDRVALELRAEGDGWSVRASDAGPDFRLLCNLKRERRRSQLVAGAMADIRTVSLALSRGE